MSNSKNYYLLRQEFEKKHLDKIALAEARKKELHEKIPTLEDIDSALSMTASRIMGEALRGRAGLDQRIAKIKEDTASLREARGMLLKEYGYPEDYTDVKYDCAKCSDTGFTDTKMCSCFKEALVMRGFESSGLGALIGKQTFENFSLDYYTAEDRERMRENLDIIKAFAASFSKSSDSLLFMGGTGLGKTHLQSAVAKAVIENGYDVLYTSALNMLSDFERVKFRGEEDDTKKYFDTALLIVDDLGTEGATSFAESTLYNIIDTRICKGLPTIVSTNLTAKELSQRYGERIFSRLLGVYKPLLFCGKDIRFERR